MIKATVPGISMLMEALNILAVNQDFSAVTGPLVGLSRVGDQDWESGGAVSFRSDKGILQEFLVSIDRIAPGQSRTHTPRVVAIEAIFQSQKIRLGDLEDSFGPWYRDPPDGEKASFASAYFNAKLINPKASFLLHAETDTGYVGQLAQSVFVQSLAASWDDSRYSSVNRPW